MERLVRYAVMFQRRQKKSHGKILRIDFDRIRFIF